MRPPKTKTKVVCTIGPATSSRSMLHKLVDAGMNVARLNFSHGTTAEHAARIHLIRAVARQMQTAIGILADLPGPKVRVGKISPEPIDLKEGAFLILTARRLVGNQRVVSVSHPSILKHLEKGDSVFLEDGTVKLEVVKARKEEALCRVISGGPLSSDKGVNLPGKRLNLQALTLRDIALLKFALANGVDFVGISFVSTGRDVLRARRILKQTNSKAWIIAKIETRSAVENIDEILRRTNAVMVARGDLGVEMDVEDIPTLQKEIIEKSNLAGKPVITATQMLESMVNNPTPTRAEVTDIANAIIDGTDAVMLSEETAVGKFPVEAVTVMKKVAAATEQNLPYRALLDAKRAQLKPIMQESISFSSCEVAYALKAGCIVANTRTGLTAHRVSKYRSPVPIIALTYDVPVMNRLSLLWGVYPFRVRKLSTTAEIFAAARSAAKNSGTVGEGDKIVVVCGDPSTPGGMTDLLRVQSI
ncbi:MAG TPA: pyruvate kinase [Candidatus Acidoferrales bacterium]|nr:pyruvate kinase [Candidatus Acidoferrales bacterium]